MLTVDEEKEMKKILFLIPPNDGMSEYMTTHHKDIPTIHYGILSIASYVKDQLGDRLDVRISNYNTIPFYGFSRNDYLDYLASEIRDYQPDFIGISGMFNFLVDMMDLLIRTIKDHFPECFVFCGGPCGMAYAEKFLLESGADAISNYEGEIPILRLLKADNPWEELDNGKSWLTAKKLQDGFSPEPEYLVDLDEIPPLHFDLLGDLSQYTDVSSVMDLDEKDYLSLPIHTTRGCPFNCIFCASSYVHGKKVRRMSSERVISDVKRMVEEYHINRLEICDDQFLINDRNRIKQILRELSKFNLDITASSGLSIIGIDDEIAYLLKAAGMHSVSLALESGSEYILKQVIEKPVVLSTVTSVVSKLKENGILVHALIVIGFPGEKEEHREETRRFLETSGFDWCSIVCATPIKGSRLYDLCVENHYIEEDVRVESGFYCSVIRTEDFTPEEITRKAYLLNLYLNFIHNYNYENGNYEIAYKYFRYVTNKFPFHAIAFYMLAKTERKLEIPDWRQHMDKFKELSSLGEWKEYAQYFHLI